MLFGFIFALGTAGASDQNLIEEAQIVSQLIIALVALGGGLVLVKIADALEYQTEIEERNQKYERYHD